MRQLVSLVVFAAACRPFAPPAAPQSPLRPVLVDDDSPPRKWPATQPDFAEVVDTMVRLSNEMCDCAARTDVACARHVVIEMELWLDDVRPRSLDADELTAEQNQQASTAATNIEECGDEVFGSAGWGPDTSRNGPNVD